MITQIMVTNIITKGAKKFGFGRSIRDGEEIFIPPHVIKINQFEIGDVLHCDLTGDSEELSDGRRCHRRVEFIYDENGPFAHLLNKSSANVEAVEFKAAPRKVEPTNEQIFTAIVAYFDDYDFATSGEVTAHLNEKFETEKSSQQVASLLEYMHKKGKLACIRMYQSTAQEKASKVAWMRRKDCNQVFEEYFGVDGDDFSE